MAILVIFYNLFKEVLVCFYITIIVSVTVFICQNKAILALYRFDCVCPCFGLVPKCQAHCQLVVFYAVSSFCKFVKRVFIIIIIWFERLRVVTCSISKEPKFL